MQSAQFNKKNLKIHSLAADERAFIHQQTEMLQKYVDGESQLKVKVDLVEKVKDESSKKTKPVYNVTLTIVNGDTQLEARSRKFDFYNAVSQASHRLMDALNQLHNEVITSQERAMELKSAFDQRNLH